MPPLTRREWLQHSAGVTLTAGLTTQLCAADKPPVIAGNPNYGTPAQYADAVFVDGPPPPPESGSFTIAVLPDTQHYSQKYPDNFHAQTKWVAEQTAERKIAAVLQLGDVTNRSTPEEWTVASQAMARLDGHVPYFLVAGNHDYSADGRCADRTTRFSEYFPRERFAGRPTFGGTYDQESARMESSYHLFEAGGRKFLVLALEYGPRNDVIRWANEIADKYADREAILITHAYMYFDETRYDWATRGTSQNWNPHASAMAKTTNDDVNDGEQLWQKLVSKHENFILTLNGHVLNDGLARLATATPGGRDVHQMLVNFQMKPNGGDGWLRLLEFKADGRTMDVVDYSPVLNRRNHSAQNKFALTTATVGKA